MRSQRWAVAGRLRRAMVLGLLLSALLIALTVVVLAHDKRPLALDTDTHAWLLRRRTGALTAAALVVTGSGTGAPAYLLAALAGAVMAGPGSTARRTLTAVGALLALLAGQGIRLLLVDAVQRPRPPRADWAGAAGGPAYPSGHTTTAALVAALIYLAATCGPQGWRRRLAQTLAIVWAGAVGLTRVYLGVHWSTDVLAGWLLAGTLVAASGAVAGALTTGWRVAARAPDS